jgi:hypothetical protein
VTSPFSREALALIEKAALEAVNADGQAFRYRFSSAGGACLRALVYESRGAPRQIPNLKQALAAACGTAVGEVMEAGAARLGWKAQEYVELPDCDVLVSGHLDCADEDRVVDFKVVKTKRWKWLLKNGPSFQYVMQCSAYATSSGRKEWALAYLRGTSIYDDGELEWKIYAMGKIWERVDAHAQAGTLPPIPSGFEKTRFPCGWCASKEECWNGGSREAGEEAGTQGGRGVVLDPQSAPADHRSDPPDHQGPQEHAAGLRLPGRG